MSCIYLTAAGGDGVGARRIGVSGIAGQGRLSSQTVAAGQTGYCIGQFRHSVAHIGRLVNRLDSDGGLGDGEHQGLVEIVAVIGRAGGNNVGAGLGGQSKTADGGQVCSSGNIAYLAVERSSVQALNVDGKGANLHSGGAGAVPV